MLPEHMIQLTKPVKLINEQMLSLKREARVHIDN